MYLKYSGRNTYTYEQRDGRGYEAPYAADHVQEVLEIERGVSSFQLRELPMLTCPDAIMPQRKAYRQYNVAMVIILTLTHYD